MIFGSAFAARSVLMISLSPSLAAIMRYVNLLVKNLQFRSIACKAESKMTPRISLKFFLIASIILFSPLQSVKLGLQPIYRRFRTPSMLPDMTVSMSKVRPFELTILSMLGSEGLSCRLVMIFVLSVGYIPSLLLAVYRVICACCP